MCTIMAWQDAQLNHNWGLGILFPKGDSHLWRLQNGKLLNFVKLYEIAAVQKLVKNHRATDIQWQDSQVNKW